MTTFEIAYVLLYFPSLSETFVADEIRKVRSIGVKVHIFSLLRPKKELVHRVSAELAPEVRYVPGIQAPSLWWAQMCVLLRAPGQYLTLLRVLLRQPAPEVSLFPKRLVVFLKAVWLAKELEKSPAQLVHTHFAWLSAAASMIVCQLLDLPFTITTHAYDIYSWKNDLFELTTRMADRIVTISEYNKRSMLEMSSALNLKQIEVIHCGIDLDRFQMTHREPANRVFEITSVGSLLKKKGHEYLIRACKELETRRVDFRCVIVGGGRLRQPLQALIQHLNLEDRVILVGTQTQTWVRDRLRKSDLFALACVVTDGGGRDGIPVAMMEALAMEVPVISTSVSGIPELIHHEETGLLVPQRDANALAAAIARLAKDEPLRQKLIRKGRTLVEREYDISKNANRLAGLFQRVIEEGRQRPVSH
jgi:glycosyltransferase involved in cell wall biosynthesis